MHLPELGTKKETISLLSDDEKEDSISKAELSLLAKISRTKLVTTKAEIEIQRQDPFSPLHSVKSFEALKMYVKNIIIISILNFYSILTSKFGFEKLLVQVICS